MNEDSEFGSNWWFDILGATTEGDLERANKVLFRNNDIFITPQSQAIAIIWSGPYISGLL